MSIQRRVYRVHFTPGYVPAFGGKDVKGGTIYASTYEITPNGAVQFYDHGDPDGKGSEQYAKPGPCFPAGTWDQVYPQGWQD